LPFGVVLKIGQFNSVLEIFAKELSKWLVVIGVKTAYIETGSHWEKMAFVKALTVLLETAY